MSSNEKIATFQTTERISSLLFGLQWSAADLMEATSYYFESKGSVLPDMSVRYAYFSPLISVFQYKKCIGLQTD